MNRIVFFLFLISSLASCSKLSDALNDTAENAQGDERSKNSGGGNGASSGGGSNTGDNGSSSSGNAFGNYLANVLVDHAKAESLTFSRDCNSGFTKYVMPDYERGSRYFCISDEPIVSRNLQQMLATYKEKTISYYSFLYNNADSSYLTILDTPEEYLNQHSTVELLGLSVNEWGSPQVNYENPYACLAIGARECSKGEVVTSIIKNHVSGEKSLAYDTDPDGILGAAEGGTLNGGTGVMLILENGSPYDVGFHIGKATEGMLGGDWVGVRAFLNHRSETSNIDTYCCYH